MDPIKISKEDIINFINSQPKDKYLSMTDNKCGDPWGCLGAQYMNEMLPTIDFRVVEESEIYNNAGELVAESELTFNKFVPKEKWNFDGHYEDLQKWINSSDFLKEEEPKKETNIMDFYVELKSSNNI